MKSEFFKGVRHGLPIGLGYLSVSFGFGIMAVQAGLSAAAAVGISATNLTSAGQAAGVGIIAAGGSYLEMALTQLVINLRYSLMGISLSQKLAPNFTVPQRMLAAFGITDEIFAVASAQKERLSADYLYGMILIAFAGWALGTLLGAVMGQILPSSVTGALGILLYGMFLAILLPAARRSRPILFVILLASLLSLLFYYTIPALSSGFSVIISSLLASAAAALLFPSPDEEVQS